MFPQIDKSQIKVGTVGYSHLVQFMNCVNAGVPSDEASLCRHGETHISKSVLVDEDAVFGMACDEGLSWTVINWQVEGAYPRLPELLAKALNVEHHIARGETWAEQLASIANRAADHQGPSKPLDWNASAEAQAKSQPPCLNDIDAHVKLCQVYGGGFGMTFIKELGEFLRIELPLGPHVSGVWIDTLARIGQSPTALALRVIMACIKAQATSFAFSGLTGSLISWSDLL